jgi:Methyltransferase small domain
MLGVPIEEIIALPTRQIEEWLLNLTTGIVQSGPFKGMKMLRERAWEAGALSPMLLGCHERELHDVIEVEIARLEKLENPKIVNIGCAEGYYAVGLALRVPKATVWAVDSSERALRIAHETAAANDVKIITGDEISLVLDAPDFVIMDCEGHESVYADPKKFPGLACAHMIIEMHGTMDAILERFCDLSHIVAYQEGARDPNDYDILRPMSSSVRWLAVSEKRPNLMGWFVMRPKGKHAEAP